MAGRPPAFGPVQALVIAFGGGNFEGAVLDELRRLREHDAVRLIDLIFVAKDEMGEVAELEQSDLSVEEAEELGSLVRSLFAPGEDAGDRDGSPADTDGAWFLADAIPPGTSAAIALVEHRWAIPLRDAIESAGGHDLVDRWIHPTDLGKGTQPETAPRD